MPHALGIKSHSHYSRYLWDIFAQPGQTSTIAANLVCLAPIQIPFKCTIDRIVMILTRVGTGGNLRAGIYADNGDTPQGGELLAETSAAVAAVTNGKNELTIPDLDLEPGLYWLAVVCSTDQITYQREPTNYYRLDSIGTYTYSLSAFGALTDPCPTLTANYYVPTIGVRVASIPNLPTHVHYARYIKIGTGLTHVGGFFNPTVLTARGTEILGIFPVEIPFKCTVDAICEWHGNIGTGGDLRGGIYKDGGDTPEAGDLLVETASAIAARATGLQALTIPETALDPALYWVAVGCSTDQINVYGWMVDLGPLGTFDGYRYTLSGFGALTNPCPTVTRQNGWVNIGCLRIVSVP